VISCSRLEVEASPLAERRASLSNWRFEGYAPVEFAKVEVSDNGSPGLMPVGVRMDAEFEGVYSREFESIYRVVFMVTRNAADAEDAVHEAFARALERWDRLRMEPWLVGWIARTALNIAKRRRLRVKEVVGLPQPTQNPGSAEEGLDREAPLDLWDEVRRLPGRQREAIVLHYVFDLPVREIAQVLQSSESTIRVHLTRGRRRLARSLGGSRNE
jgi:RNA polymerase sigma-70 factor, ECF subfamily